MAGLGFQRLRGGLMRRYLDHCGYGSGRQFIARMVASVGPGDVLLDAGCGEGNLRSYFTHTVYYVGLDRYFGEQKNEYTQWNIRPSVLGDIHKIPLATCSCNVIALMQVLEHAREPERVFAEIFRVLKPGGSLFLTVPFLHEIHHAPHDYYRYTPYALTILAQIAGLVVIEIRPSGGYFRTLSHLLEAAPKVICRPTVSSTLVRFIVAYPLKAFGWIIKKLQYLLDIHDGTRAFISGYECIFRKPADETC